METEANDINKLREAALFLATKLAAVEKLPAEEQELLGRLFSTHFSKIKRFEPGTKASYYCERYAVWLRDKVLAVLEANPDKSLILKRQDFSNIGQRTLLARIGQAWSYLTDYLDTPDKRYTNLRDHYMLQPHVEGIIINKKLVLDSVEPTVHLVDATAPTRNRKQAKLGWREKIDNWMETCQENDKLEIIPDPFLTDEEIKWLTEEYLYPIRDGFIWSVNKKRIFICKSEELAKLLAQE